MRKKSETILTTKLLSSILIAFVVSLGLICVYYGSAFAPGIRTSDHLASADGTDPVVGKFSDDVEDRDAAAFDSFDDDLPQRISDFPKSIPVCDSRFSELIPCLDRNLIYQMKLKLNLSLMEHYERHCPPPQRRYNCLIPPPAGYKIPIRWPASRDEVWKVNIPHTHLASEKSDQNWMVVNGDKINFPGGGTHFHYGADKYIASIAKMLKFPDDNLNNGGNIRTVLDVGCGVASFGAYLLPLNIIAMSLAPNDVHENQIQFALERGIPSTLGVLGTKRLPYPSHSFELAHCSRCRIDWLQRDGILLLELDRLLRPGGYFVYSSPEAYSQDQENRRIWFAMSNLLGRMCWKVVSKRDQTVIWMKPLSNSCYLKRDPGTQPPLCSSNEDPDASWNVSMKACITPYSKKMYNFHFIWMKPLSNSCYLKRDPGTQPPLCSSNEDPDASWNVSMKACITPYSKKMHRAKGSELAPWPQRLTAPPPRLDELGISAEKYQEDTEVWRWRVIQYWKQMKSKFEKNSFRNIMDMNSNLGGFAASLKDMDVWVMNVVSVNESSKLKIIYDRGLLGTVHDWCESFSTYPRTYDLLHAWGVFSEIDQRGCSMEDLLFDMDRILRPVGFVILRDKPSVISYIQKFLTALRWDDWSSEVEPKVDALSLDEERVLIARKRLWEDGVATL